MNLAHLDEHGQICTRHPSALDGELLALALVGSRAPSFHHDLASKLQGLMMAIDEIGEVSGDVPPPVMRAMETAQVTLREVLALLNANRTMTKPPVRTRIALADLLARSAERVYVGLRGAVPAAIVEVPVPALIHALSLVLDVAGGPGRGRAVEATTTIHDGVAVIAFGASPEVPPDSGQSIALATFAIGREGGTLRCAGEGARIVVRLPVVS